MTQTKQQTDLNNRWHSTGYEDLGIGFNRSPESLRRLLNGETSDQRAQAQHKKAADYLNQWNSQRAAERLETFAKVAGIITLIVFVLVMLYP